ncbi:DUF3047 domain-containing protein [Niveibacterium microcysteis]|uniref:DUF3047 domain-containing protein n=1 Tax=Niveibacterium microcysteis TaxID=2811415 RepID=A0ABX7MC13_9RHOO|nr:DUF3047 domain-containing protein [Niveibacterium microcysteis]QSI77042.1 DUF3047 domain-containing protein [Niveibacterium microcysteis]
MPAALRKSLLVLILGCFAGAALADAPCAPRKLGFDQPGWAHRPLSKTKRDTKYSVADDGGTKVLHADADGSASYFVNAFARPVAAPPVLRWRWQTDAAVPGADNRDKKKEDAPLRVIVAFDGDVSTLPEEEQKRFKRAKTLLGKSVPYAVLMYTWSDKIANDTVVPSAHSSQVKMIAIAPGTLGQWQTLSRDVAADYHRAWGSEPGPVLGVAVMSDTDNTGAKAAGDYADLAFECGR